jgi:chromosome segregation and condensation protein ScpB
VTAARRRAPPRKAADPPPLDRELADLPDELRWREWMARVEAVIFAAPAPVPHEVLSRLVGDRCILEDLLTDIRAELRGRPYELVFVAGGFQHRTRPRHAEAIRAAGLVTGEGRALSETESLVLMAVGYFQPVTRGDIGRMLGREISRDLLAGLRRQNLIAAGPRSPQPGAPVSYVTTAEFLVRFGFASLRELPDIEALEEAGLLSKDKLLAGDGLDVLGESSADEEDDAVEAEEAPEEGI